MRTRLLFIRVLLLAATFVCLAGCERKKVPLNEKEFTSLLIDIHLADGTLSVAKGLGGLNDMKNYAYYNDVFNKYGIGRAEFDSCLHYYSAQTVKFSKMYDAVIDSLNRQLTAIDMILNQLRSRDSVNLFPVSDTLVFDSCYTHISVEMDSILPGQYNFSTIVRFDTLDKGKNNRITSYFISPDNQDTLFVRNVTVESDTLEHHYNWSQYIDSTYNRLVIKFVDSDNLEKLKYRKGKAWKMELFRPYLSREAENRLKQTFSRHKIN